MQRRQVLFGALGLLLAAATARADVPKTVKIAGQNYTVTSSPRTGTFKNGVTVNLQKGGGGALSDDDVAKKANLAFAPGGTPSGDRLFVVAAHQDDPDATSDALYMLKGTDANGAFTLKDSEATVFLRGNRDVHGRPQNVTWINDADTGVKKDRNIYMCTFTGQNRLRFYDLDTLNGTAANAFRDLNVFSIKEPGDGCAATPPDVDPDMVDANAPNSDFQAGAMTANGMMMVAGADTDADGNTTIAIGVIDPVKGTQFFPVKTDLNKATGGNKITPTEQPICFVRLTGDEYLMVATDPGTGGNATEADLNSQTLYHLKITLPADLTKTAPNSIQAQLIDKTDLPSLNLGQSPTHKIQGVAVGREVTAGKPVLYMADWAGNLFTLRPQ